MLDPGEGGSGRTTCDAMYLSKGNGWWVIYTSANLNGILNNANIPSLV